MPILIALAVVVILFIVGVNVIGFGLNLLWMLLLGLIIGAVARLLVPGRQEMSVLLTSLIGVVGALTGGLLADRVFDWGGIAQFLASLVVAAVLVAIAAGSTRSDSGRINS
ncbi:MAG: hypothetical protein JWM25_1168 [Thermoleophilia bacterium]|nr:hypothetical protein [Thermoleophilia bacterium]MCZ4496585.1 hypothetical protein [Thermoleophilia bacterium]